MQPRSYLITAATGKTGVYVVRQLLAEGHRVRAFVHSDDQRSDDLRQAGAEIVVGDLLEHDDIIKAMEGMNGAYLCYPVREGYIQVTANLADAARRAGVEVVVEMSQISARDDAKSHAARNHWLAERVLDWSGVPTVHIRPTFFAEWLTFPWVRDPIVNDNKLTLPYGAGRHAPIAAQDQARLIVSVLTHPAPHIGKTYTLCGPVEMDHGQIAEELSAVLGRTISYAPSTLDEYRAHLKSYGLPEFLIQHFIEVAIDYQNGIFEGEDGVIAQITGQAPQTVKAFLQANLNAFQ
ncbi:NAD(P)H-binding protein [Pseudomonas sp. GD03842]|uniref:NAD(P)H-binding protein n=1 Tax=Pseudomonas sp. GD03842 TaxID=2975385 RepID=UPI002449CD30|nr:NAD(P)H-binding protein [Pseudomonas sp. GD03842]MDH0749559.1 NAD(P)H-binding protein [Pseudomonas sp. GD03842]